MRSFGAAVVGCGALAQLIHLPSLVRNPRLRLLIVCDRDRNTADSCLVRFGAERCETDWRKVVASPDVDLIILAAHTELRAELIVPALRAGKPVYVEKPVASSKDEALEIVRASLDTGVPVCVGHNRRSSPAMLEFKRLAEKALSGIESTPPSIDRRPHKNRIPEENWTQILIRINDDIRSWKDWVMDDPQGILYAEMVHFIDLALWLNKGRPARVFAEGSHRGNFCIVIRFDDGSITTMHHTMVGHFDYPKELFEFTARHFTVAMEQHLEVRQFGFSDEPTLSFFPDTSSFSDASELGIQAYLREFGAEGREPRWLNVNKGHYEHLDRFLDCIEGTGENPCSALSAVPVIDIALKLSESIRSGLPVQIDSEELCV